MFKFYGKRSVFYHELLLCNPFHLEIMQYLMEAVYPNNKNLGLGSPLIVNH